MRSKIVEFVERGEFGLASGKKPDGTYEHVWFEELIARDEVAFETGVFLLRKSTAVVLKKGVPASLTPTPESEPEPSPTITSDVEPGPQHQPELGTKTLRLIGIVPPEVWNRLGTKILPKVRSGSDLKVGLDFSVTVKADAAQGLASELRQVLDELGLGESVRIE